MNRYNFFQISKKKVFFNPLKMQEKEQRVPPYDQLFDYDRKIKFDFH